MAYVNVKQDPETSEVTVIVTRDVHIKIASDFKDHFGVQWMNHTCNYFKKFLCPDGIEREGIWQYKFTPDKDDFEEWYWAAKQVFVKLLKESISNNDN